MDLVTTEKKVVLNVTEIRDEKTLSIKIIPDQKVLNLDAGDIGAQGPQGDKGDQGEVGPQGLIGPQGIQGLKGDTGDQGPQGIQGIQGDTGPQGPAGTSFTWKGNWSNLINYLINDAVGRNGSSYIATANNINHDPETDASHLYWADLAIEGAIGPQGPQGNQGEIGPQGLQGIQGVQGIKGDTGNTGAKGDKGDNGNQGPQGDQGIQGIQGPQGIAGPSNLFVQNSTPSSPPSQYMWLQTGLGISGKDMTIWVEDGT